MASWHVELAWLICWFGTTLIRCHLPARGHLCTGSLVGKVARAKANSDRREHCPGSCVFPVKGSPNWYQLSERETFGSDQLFVYCLLDFVSTISTSGIGWEI